MITLENLKEALYEQTKETTEYFESSLKTLLEGKTEQEKRQIFINFIVGNDLFKSPYIIIPPIGNPRQNPEFGKRVQVCGKDLLDVLNKKSSNATTQLNGALANIQDSNDISFTLYPTGNKLDIVSNGRHFVINGGNSRLDLLKIIGYEEDVNKELLNEVLDKIKDTGCYFGVDYSFGNYRFEITTGTVFDKRTGMDKFKGVEGDNLNDLLVKVMKSYNDKWSKEMDKIAVATREK